MREAGQVAAAVRIVEAARSAMADAMEAHAGVGWDGPLLAYEVARMLGSLLRAGGLPPEELELAVRFAREVYAGIHSGRFLAVDEAITHFCPASTAGPSDAATH
jgi:hypothetical protein